jgi:hypothetical protein
MHDAQGGQIGRIFAHWAIVYCGQFLENYRSSPNFWTTIFLGKKYVLSLTIKLVGIYFGRFFLKKNSSGHPDDVGPN